MKLLSKIGVPGFAIVAILAMIAAALALLAGWVMNIIAIIHSTSLTGMLVVRVIGIFLAPLGGVLGWF